MPFLKRKFKPWTLAWFIQRSLLMILEFRFPDLGLKWRREMNQIKKKYLQEAREKIENSRKIIVPQGFKPLRTKSDTDFQTSVYPILTASANENKKLINRYFDKIFVINLRRRHDRRLKVVQTLGRLGIEAEIFFADEGYDEVNIEEYLKYAVKPIGGEGAHRMERRYSKKMIMGPGAWAYLKTYRRLLNHAKEKGYRRILCFDDDVVFHKNFHELFEERIRVIPEDWKLLYFGATQHGWHTVEKDPLNQVLTDKSGDLPPYYHPRYTDGTFAIGFDQSVFDILLEEISKMNCSFDSGPVREINFRFPGKTFVILPNLVIADVSESDIGSSREQEEFAVRMRWKMDQYNFPFEYDLVSVIMPAFNAEKTIEKSIRSILMQTYRNLELIVADDGSSDSTPQLVESLAREDPRVHLVKLGSNQGCYSARNAAIRASKGRYIAIQDADDVALRHRLEKQLIPLCAGQADFTVAHVFRSRCSMDELDISDQKALAELVLARRKKKTGGSYAYRDQPILGLMTSVFRREVFQELGLFWENRFGADSEFAERILFARKGFIIDDKETGVQYHLARVDKIDGVYKRINEVLMVSADMNEQNITGSYTKAEREIFIQNWRSRFKGEFDYIYPTLNK